MILETNGMATASLVCSLVGILFCLTSPLGIIFGHIALSQIRRRRNTQGGRGMAIAGLVIGYLTLAFWIVFFIISVASDTNDTNY